jgi:hypothetical protein
MSDDSSEGSSVMSDNSVQLMTVGHKKRAKLPNLKIGHIVFDVADAEDKRDW